MFGAADGVQICFRVGQRAPGTALERREGARVRHEQPVVGEPFETRRCRRSYGCMLLWSCVAVAAIARTE